MSTVPVVVKPDSRSFRLTPGSMNGNPWLCVMLTGPFSVRVGPVKS